MDFILQGYTHILGQLYNMKVVIRITLELHCQSIQNLIRYRLNLKGEEGCFYCVISVEILNIAQGVCGVRHRVGGCMICYIRLIIILFVI